MTGVENIFIYLAGRHASGPETHSQQNHQPRKTLAHLTGSFGQGVLFWETSFSTSCDLCVFCVRSFEFEVIFIELQHLYNHFLYKYHLAICDFALTL